MDTTLAVAAASPGTIRVEGRYSWLKGAIIATNSKRNPAALA
jgi:hypothetical protein